MYSYVQLTCYCIFWMGVAVPRLEDKTCTVRGFHRPSDVCARRGGYKTAKIAFLLRHGDFGCGINDEMVDFNRETLNRTLDILGEWNKVLKTTSLYESFEP